MKLETETIVKITYNFARTAFRTKIEWKSHIICIIILEPLAPVYLFIIIDLDKPRFVLRIFILYIYMHRIYNI